MRQSQSELRTLRANLPVRLLILIIITLLAARPLARLGGNGIDVIILADLSRSMPADSRSRQLEIIKLIEERRRSGDRVGIVTYGREPRIERLPEEFGQVADYGVTTKRLNGKGARMQPHWKMAKVGLRLRPAGNLRIHGKQESNYRRNLGLSATHAAHFAHALVQLSCGTRLPTGGRNPPQMSPACHTRIRYRRADPALERQQSAKGIQTRRESRRHLQTRPHSQSATLFRVPDYAEWACGW